MPESPPNIDNRTYEEIVNQTETLAQHFSDWRPLPDGQPDAGRALIRIFGRMAALVSDRLNQSLQKNFLAYLDLIGTQLQPPRSARVPLTFTLTEGSQGTVVSAYTQVASLPGPGEIDEVIFETEQELAITAAQLQAVYVHQPELDCYQDCTDSATGQIDGAFAAFEAAEPVEHSFYFTIDDLLAIESPTETNFTINSTNAFGLFGLPMTWSIWNGTEWQTVLGIQDGLNVVISADKKSVTISPGTAINGDGDTLSLDSKQTKGDTDFNEGISLIVLSDDGIQIEPKDETEEETRMGNMRDGTIHTLPSNAIRLAYLNVDADKNITSILPETGGDETPTTISFTQLPTPQVVSVNGVDAAWIKVQLDPRVPLPPGQESPGISSITATVNVAHTDVIPDLCYFNDEPLDLTKDYYPLGEQPRFNDTFYVASQKVLAKGGETVTVAVTLSGEVDVNGNPSLNWEAWNGDSWEPLLPSPISIALRDDPEPLPCNFTYTGSFEIMLPQSIALHTLNDEENYWLQTRLVSGNYGTDATINPDGTYVPESWCPPSIQSLTLSCSYTINSLPVSACYTYNNFTYVDVTAASSGSGESFSPFTNNSNPRPALYLGFDQAFANEPTTLYVQADLPQPGEIARRQPVDQPARVAWDYAKGNSWSPLGATDTSNGLRERGLVRFIGPADLSSRSEFGQSLYWLRAQWLDGDYELSPRLRRVMTNTTWAVEATTLINEILGSSTGNPGQQFTTAQAPILAGQQLEVREQEIPPDAELAALQALEGDDAVTIITDDADQPEEIWIRWHEVVDFYGSGPQDRHYILDRLTGTVQFGNDCLGRVPLAGRNNIRMAYYRTGGGSQGNRAADSITELKTTIPYIDSVTNLEPATGGSEQESLGQLQTRGPKRLRHRYRAVTAQDMEDLACETSPEVARAVAITPEFFSNGLTWLPNYQFTVAGPGDIIVTLSHSNPDTLLIVSIYGPGQGMPYHQETISYDDSVGASEFLAVTYTVTDADIALGTLWSVIITTPSTDTVDGQVTITYPTNSIEADFSALSATSHSGDITNGQVTVIIVPESDAQQPTPSLGLIEQVKTYLLERSSASLESLEVTEPDWVEVVVTTAIAPTSLEVAGTVLTTVKTALTQFLHPLTGGPGGEGWPFGRQPHKSDLYALLESISGVDHVESLEMTMVAIDAVDMSELNNWTATHLVFSGEHNVSLV